MDNSPVFNIPASNALALPVLKRYREMCSEFGLYGHAADMDNVYADMQNWQEANPSQVRLPQRVSHVMMDVEQKPDTPLWEDELVNGVRDEVPEGAGGETEFDAHKVICKAYGNTRYLADGHDTSAQGMVTLKMAYRDDEDAWVVDSAWFGGQQLQFTMRECEMPMETPGNKLLPRIMGLVLMDHTPGTEVYTNQTNGHETKD